MFNLFKKTTDSKSLTFTGFLSSFKKTDVNTSYKNEFAKIGLNSLNKHPDLSQLLNTLGGAIFDNGLLKIHTIGSSYFWAKEAFNYFKSYKKDSYCFAFDWTGRQYAINYSNSKPIILMLDAATQEVFELQQDLNDFLNKTLIEDKEASFETDKFNLLQAGTKLKFNECFGFINPLFLGGSEAIENYKAIDLEVDWEFSYQIYNQIKDLPPGTPVNISLK